MTRLAPRLASRAALVTVMVAALAGCTTAGSGEPEPTTDTEPTASASPTPTTAPAAFTLPDDCSELVGPDLAAEYAANDVVLFSDSNGNGIYEQERSVGQDGGEPLYCVYGQDGVDLSSFEFAAQALTNDAHEGVLAELATRGLDESADGERVIFSQEGDEGTLPAIVHIVLPDGWVTVNSTFGGPDRFAEVNDWAETAVEQLYPAP
ncbi:hypothetical protein [Marisediminicola antarctica]|uniref:DUF3558 domain-containing protein n=1 Tax=Marisediminicola antarctica TaxID=674079 RepID=A0A7L5AK95_9MICO|nr:hypothetical protein [Marisediminicola antarctica]QHO69541.1 hypothetical protein BHD05_07690 [Marisediminicola antarctica]